MKKEYEMTEEELQAIYDISRHQTPVIYVGVWLGMDSQEQANKLWHILADKYGFKWDTVGPCPGKGHAFFMAEPLAPKS